MGDETALSFGSPNHGGNIGAAAFNARAHRGHRMGIFALFKKDPPAAPTADADAVLQWERTVAAMKLHEREAAIADAEFSRSMRCCYCMQNGASLVSEAPCRWVYHTSCACLCAGLSAVTCMQPAPSACAAHHVATQHEYAWLLNFLCENVTRPHTAYWIYKQDVRLKRPPHPRGEQTHSDGGGGKRECCECTDKCEIRCDPTACCEECCSCDCLGTLEQLLNREIRSLLCLFSCLSSLHPARCCGPAPCWESMEERHSRWTSEIETAMDERTAKFYETYAPEQLVFERSKSSRRRPLIARRVVEGKPVPGGEPTAMGAAGTVVPQAQSMDR